MEREGGRDRGSRSRSQPVQRGFTPVGRHDKSGLGIMDESSILRRRGLQVGEQTLAVFVELESVWVRATG